MRWFVGFMRARSAGPGARVAGWRPALRRGLGLACSLTVIGVALAGCGAAPREFGGGPGRGGGSGGMRVVLFYAPDSPGGSLSAAEQSLLAKHRSEVSAFTPLWFHVENDGSVKSTMNSSLAGFIRKEKIPLIPLVNNASGANQFLTNASARSTAVANLVRIVQQNGFQGIHIDFELLKPSDRAGLTDFMRALYGQLHPKGKQVAIDVIPESKVGQSGQPYNFATLAKYADSVVLMSYDEHDDGSEPGPVAALPWVKTRLSVALKAGIPANKLDLGIADYGYDWQVDSAGRWVKGTHAKTLGMAQIEAKGVKPTRDSAGDPHYSYTVNGKPHVVWYEDQVSVVGKVKLAKAEHLQGVALWRAGYENEAFWKALTGALR